MSGLNIGQAAARSGLPPKTIRYYEEIGLLPPPARSEAGYRRYGERDLATLAFIQRARSLGFSVEDCRGLLALWQDRDRASAEVKSLALARIEDIEAKIAELRAMRDTLADLAERCHGDERPDCPILSDLARAGRGKGGRD
ncbi:Cu(I)-responsive transcriptional regulator [Geminicoccaceae bacterium 1502E]|nr:Cu(I)-responsive transcriptional regulator [Geminicoccaceae bacterium 1502E]